MALLQLFSLREFEGSRTRSLKVPRAAPRKDCRRRATKSNATYVCRAQLALPSNQALEPKRLVWTNIFLNTHADYKLQLAETCAHDAKTCMCTHIRPPAEASRSRTSKCQEGGVVSRRQGEALADTPMHDETHPTQTLLTKALGIQMPARSPSFASWG